MVKGGYFGIRGNLASNLSEMESTLGNKRFTVSEAAKNLPIYSQYIRQQIASDNTALATKNLPRAAKEAFKAQKEEADESLKKIDAMIREIREASKNTKLSGESVDKLARESATQLTNSGLPKAIAEALGPVIAHYMKMPKVTGTSSASTRTSINPVP